jgi:hypothetical protein
MKITKAAVLREAELRGLDVYKPTREAPEILIYTADGRCVADAKTWPEAYQQVVAAYRIA